MEGGSNTSKVLYRSAIIFFPPSTTLLVSHRRSRLEHENIFTGFFVNISPISNYDLLSHLLLSPFYFRIISLFLLRGGARLFCVSTSVNVILRLLFFPSYGGGVGFFLHLGEQSQTQSALHLGQESFKSGGGEGFTAFLVPSDVVMPAAWGRPALHFCAQGVSFN